VSLRVLVIAEDFVKDQYFLKPLFEKMFDVIGRRANVEVCMNPRLRGTSEALDGERIGAILDMYPMVQLFLLIVDRDGNDGQEGRKDRRAVLDGIERSAAERLSAGRLLVADQACEEVEVWLLAGHDLPSGLAWASVRAHRDPKEAYYNPFARARGVFDAPAEGRRILGREAVARYDRIRQLCPELDALHRRVEALVRAKSPLS
jgi:hypothetical protein